MTSLIDLQKKKVVDTIPRSMINDVAYSCAGGILADNPGMGKTVTLLALLHSNPVDSLDHIQMPPEDKLIRLPSRATLIVCPSNLVTQWRDEVVKCLPKETKCIFISTIFDHRKVTWRDAMLADIIIVPVTFFANVNYQKVLDGYNKPLGPQRLEYWENYFAGTMKPLIRAGYQSFWNNRGNVNLECLYYHRIVFDEFHELGQKPGFIKAIVSSLKGSSHWGMTGTPHLESG
jgi:superfamily II DNA or RNA helicase